MSVHNLPYVTHTISFNKALLLFAERLFLSQGGTPAKWARWIAAKDTADGQESRLLSSQEQMAKQDKVEFHIFIAEDVAAFMRKLLLANEPPAYVNTKQEGLFRAAPSIFDDAELIKALIARNIPVNSPVAGRFELPGMPELGSWENSYNFNKTGRIVFVAREVESALNNAAPLQVVGNDNRSAHEPVPNISVAPDVTETAVDDVTDNASGSSAQRETMQVAAVAVTPAAETGPALTMTRKKSGAKREYNRDQLLSLAQKTMAGDFGAIPRSFSFSALCRVIAEQLPERCQGAKRVADSLRKIDELVDFWDAHKGRTAA